MSGYKHTEVTYSTTYVSTKKNQQNREDCSTSTSKSFNEKGGKSNKIERSEYTGQSASILRRNGVDAKKTKNLVATPLAGQK